MLGLRADVQQPVLDRNLDILGLDAGQGPLDDDVVTLLNYVERDRPTSGLVRTEPSPEAVHRILNPPQIPEGLPSL